MISHIGVEGVIEDTDNMYELNKKSEEIFENG